MGRSRRVLIAGGGIGGLAAALALLRDGHEVTVCEQAKELREVGAGVQLAANATRVLIELGLGKALEKVACVPAGKEVRLYDTGKTWKLFDLGEESMQRYGAPYWLLHRADLHDVLVDALRERWPHALLTSAHVTAFNQSDTHVELLLADGRKLEADALIGADGIHSVVRRSLFGDMNVNFLGRAAWRGVVPAARLPEHLRRLVATNWVGPGVNAVVYPLRRGELINFVGAIGNVKGWTSESWTDAGTTEEVLADFQGWHADIQQIVRQIEVPLKWAYRGREPLQQWSVGNVTLLGDAAHPTLPTLAQGANMAIEDGLVLARCLRLDEPISSTLRRYEAARVPRTSKIVRSSTENARRFQDDRLGGADASAYVDKEWHPDAIAERYNWLFEYDARTTSI